MSPFPRSVFPVHHVELAPPNQTIVKYMSWQKFQDLVNRSAMYFRRIDHFIDMFEGRIPLAIWDLTNLAIQDWYNRCKEEIFVSCWNMDEEETSHMWQDYAAGYGVRIRSTVSALTTELSLPPLAPTEYDHSYKDSFTLGKIKYINFDAIDIHQIMAEGLSNTVPAFRKRYGYVSENEFRAILRPGSKSGDEARAQGDVHVYIPVRLQNLIQEVRFAPVDDADLEKNIKKLLAENNLSAQIVPAALGIKKGK